MKTLDTIQCEVGEWSRNNFGEQQSKVDPDLMLGSLAPLMGLVEELGELVDALEGINAAHPDEDTTKQEEAIEDALGDIGIYLCDYAQREHFQLSLMFPELSFACDAFVGIPTITSALGKLYHATLKRHQGIRGMGDLTHYKLSRNSAITQFCIGLRSIADQEGFNLLEVINTTWEQVSARDWKHNPQGPTTDEINRAFDLAEPGHILGQQAAEEMDEQVINQLLDDAVEVEPLGDQFPIPAPIQVGHVGGIMTTVWTCSQCNTQNKVEHQPGRTEFLCVSCGQSMKIMPGAEHQP